MSLEVGQADEHVGIHDGTADEGFLRVLAAFHGYGNVVGTLQTIGDDDRAAGGKRREAILPRALQVFQGIFPESRVHGVAVCQEGFSAEFLDEIDDGFCVVGTEVADVAQFPEMHFDGDKLAVHVDVGHPGPAGQPLQLGRHALPERRRPEVGVIYFSSFHEAKIKKEDD